jgi:hypothetical protein
MANTSEHLAGNSAFMPPHNAKKRYVYKNGKGSEITKILGSEFQLVWKKNFLETSIILKYRYVAAHD